MDDIWVSDYMTRDVVTCPSDTSINEVVAELQSNVFSCLVVVDGEKPVGTISQREMIAVLADLLGEEDWQTMRVEHFMKTPADTVQSDLTIMEAVTFMQQRNARHIPVINTDGLLVGILSQTDVIRGFYNTWLEME